MIGQINVWVNFLKKKRKKREDLTAVGVDI